MNKHLDKETVLQIADFLEESANMLSDDKDAERDTMSNGARLALKNWATALRVMAGEVLL